MLSAPQDSQDVFSVSWSIFWWDFPEYKNHPAIWLSPWPWNPPFHMANFNTLWFPDIGIPPVLIHFNSMFPYNGWVNFIVYLWISWNGGTPKSSILVGFSLINHPFGGTPIDGNLHISFPHWSSAPRRPGPLPGQVVRARRGFAARLHHHRAPWRSHRATRGPYDVRQGQVFVEKTHVFLHIHMYMYIYI